MEEWIYTDLEDYEFAADIAQKGARILLPIGFEEFVGWQLPIVESELRAYVIPLGLDRGRIYFEIESYSLTSGYPRSLALGPPRLLITEHTEWDGNNRVTGKFQLEVLGTTAPIEVRLWCPQPSTPLIRYFERRQVDLKARWPGWKHLGLVKDPDFLVGPSFTQPYVVRVVSAETEQPPPEIRLTWQDQLRNIAASHYKVKAIITKHGEGILYEDVSNGEHLQAKDFSLVEQDIIADCWLTAQEEGFKWARFSAQLRAVLFADLWQQRVNKWAQHMRAPSASNSGNVQELFKN